MKRRATYYVLLFAACTLLFPLYLSASHIVGGELNYRYLAKDAYEITLTVYRDCDPKSADYDPVALIGVFNRKDEMKRVLELRYPGATFIPPQINSKCAQTPSGICYEVAYYIDTVQLDPIPGGYQLVYQQCCWNFQISNILNPDPNNTGSGTTGITIYAEIPDITEIPVNSNPVFNDLTPPYICLGTRFEFDHSAKDPDGDSLAYRLFTPWDGRQTIYYPPPSGSLLPAPPFTKEVEYQSGFTLANVMGGDPMVIDEKTGLITAKPNEIGKYVFGVEVMEYRRGVYLGSTRRSYQVNTRDCPGLTGADMNIPELYCGITTVNFTNASIGSTKYYWNFGDPNDPGANSTLQDPVYTYADTGKYTVTLIAYSTIDPVQCNDTTTKEIQLTDEYYAEAHFDILKCTNEVPFYASAPKVKGFGNIWYWDFGDGDSSELQNPHHFYKTYDVFNIMMIANSKTSHAGCSDTIYLTYNAEDQRPATNAEANKNSVYKNADSVKLNAYPDYGYVFQWSPEEGLNDPAIKNPVAKPHRTITYYITVIDSLGCMNRDSITIHVNPYRCGEADIFIPNAFTPNGDGENDFLRVRGEGISELYFAVYNRWGELVYESTDTRMISEPTVGWDGNYNGNKLSPGVFVYYVRAVCQGNYEFIKKGNITLLR